MHLKTSGLSNTYKASSFILSAHCPVCFRQSTTTAERGIFSMRRCHVFNAFMEGIKAVKFAH